MALSGRTRLSEPHANAPQSAPHASRYADRTMTFRLTHRASKKLRIRCEQLEQSHASRLEWYCNLVTVQRRQFFLFTHAATLFSLGAPAAGWNRTDFSPRFRHHVMDTLRDYGFADGDIARIVDDEPDIFATSADRGVLGSMVDYAKMLQYTADYVGGLAHMSTRSMNDIANECPMGRIGMEMPVRSLRQFLQAERAV